MVGWWDNACGGWVGVEMEGRKTCLRRAWSWCVCVSLLAFWKSLPVGLT